MTRPQTAGATLYARITNQIVGELERGVRPWTKPWTSPSGEGVALPLRHGGEPYRGINVLLLWAEALRNGYRDPTWMTFRQALALGGHVRRGEDGATVVFAGQRADRDAPDHEDDRRPGAWFLRAYTVFNTAQIEGLPEVLLPPSEPAGAEFSASREAEAFFQHVPLDLRHGGDRAFYAMAPDYVQMPPRGAFHQPDAYYATLGHETVHWTRHASRLDRDFGQARWGDEGYAMEELVAELGAAFLCARLGVSLVPRTEHADYLASWLKVLRGDQRAIFTAAAHAQRAIDYLAGLQPP